MLYRETYDEYNKHRSFLRNAHCKLQGVCVGVADVLYLVFAFLSILICYVWLLPMTMPNGCDKTGAMLQGEGVRGRDPGNRLHKTEMQTKTLTPMYVCT